MITRRRLILGMGAVAATAGLRHWPGELEGDSGRSVFFSAADDSQGRHLIEVLDGTGRPLRRAVIPQRAHSVALSRDSRFAVFFARRPGRYAWRLAFEGHEPPEDIVADPDRHFYGHGCFSADGRRLYTAENDFGRGRGVIVERDVGGLKRLREFPSHGVGPHDVRLMPDGRTLVVANGGIRTHPDAAGEKLNLSSMQPSLTYIDIESGDEVESVRPPHHQLSIRHLWVSPEGMVGVAMQYQGPPEQARPLVAFHRRGEALKTAAAPLVAQRRMQGYTASICVNPDSGIAAVTCPRGDLVTFWDSVSGRFLGRQDAIDPGGANLDPTGRGFIVTTSTGQLLRMTGPGHSEVLAALPERRWDNHLVTAAG